MTAAKLWAFDDELFALVQRELFTCVVGDLMPATISPGTSGGKPTRVRTPRDGMYLA